MVRSTRFNLYGEASYEHQLLDDHLGSIATYTSKKNDVGAIGLYGDHTDASGGMTTFSLHLGEGNLRIETPAAMATDNATANTNGEYSKLNYELAHYQPLARNTMLLLLISGQLASKNLDSAEKFSLGGPFGVRAYPVGEAAGDDGYLVSTELRYGLPQPLLGARLTLIGFADAGSTKINHNPFMADNNERHLAAGGLGCSLAAPGHVVLQFSYAWKLGHAPAVSDTDRSGQAWLHVQKNF